MKYRPPIALAIASLCLIVATGYPQLPTLTPEQEAERAVRQATIDAAKERPGQPGIKPPTQPRIQPEIQPAIQPEIQPEGAKRSVLESAPVNKAMKCLEEALEGVDSAIKVEPSQYDSYYSSSDPRREAKLHSKNIVMERLQAAQKELRILKQSEATDGKKAIQNALASIPEKSMEQAHSYYTGNYSRPANNWDARKTKGEIEKAIKLLTP